jgi:hypothetical protein
VKCPLERVLLFLECLVFCGGKHHLIAWLPYTLELLVGALGLLVMVNPSHSQGVSVRSLLLLKYSKIRLCPPNTLGNESSPMITKRKKKGHKIIHSNHCICIKICTQKGVNALFLFLHKSKSPKKEKKNKVFFYCWLFMLNFVPKNFLPICSFLYRSKEPFFGHYVLC